MPARPQVPAKPVPAGLAELLLDVPRVEAGEEVRDRKAGVPPRGAEARFVGLQHGDLVARLGEMQRGREAEIAPPDHPQRGPPLPLEPLGHPPRRCRRVPERRLDPHRGMRSLGSPLPKGRALYVSLGLVRALTPPLSPP